MTEHWPPDNVTDNKFRVWELGGAIDGLAIENVSSRDTDKEVRLHLTGGVIVHLSIGYGDPEAGIFGHTSYLKCEITTADTQNEPVSGCEEQ